MDRYDLARQFIGNGAELGVAAGDYSAEILANRLVTHLWSIDRWSDHHDDREYETCKTRLSVFGKRSSIIRSTFTDARVWVPDRSLNFIYIDGYAHTGQEGGQTLREWWPKLKPGGIFAGHDYDTEYQPTIEAVDRFAAEHGLKIRTTDEQQYRSWYTEKL